MHKNVVEAVLKQNLSEVETTATHSLVYHNSEVIREMLCVLSTLCGQGVPPSQAGGRTGENKKFTTSQVEAKPINLTRHQSSTYEPGMIYLPASKGQFICPNCGEDFLNRDALAMHMMESVHSEACAATIGSASKESRTQRPAGCHHVKGCAPNHPTGPARRFVQLPVPVGNNTVPFHSLVQSFMKTRSLLDAGVPRPGRKPRRLIPLNAEEDGCRSVQAGTENTIPLLLKRPKSCESKPDSLTVDEALPNRASSTPGGAQTLCLGGFADRYADGARVLRKTDCELADLHRSPKGFDLKAVRAEPPAEKRVRVTNAEASETPTASRGGSKETPKSTEFGVAGNGTQAPGTSCQWQASDSDQSAATVHYAFVCRHCVIGFSDQTLFNLHMGLHTSFNPWQCNMCSREFSNVYEFTAHALHY